MKRPTAARLARVFERYYRRPGNGAGGHLYIFLYDGSARDADLEFCIAWAEVHGDHSGARVARLARLMTTTQRTKARMLARDALLKAWRPTRGQRESRQLAIKRART